MNIVISVKTEALIARLAGAPDKMRRALSIAAQRLAIDVQRAVKEEKLSGQVLHVRTGTLRRSINQEVTTTEDGVWAIVGTNVEYAAIHEYGFTGIVNVREYVRNRRTAARMSSGRRLQGKVIAGTESVVRAHTRRVNVPERSFLRSTLLEFEPRIRQDLRDAAMSVLK